MIRIDCRLPRDGSAVVATREGYVMLAPLPDERWVTFVGDLDERECHGLSPDRRQTTVAAAIERRIAAPVRVEDVAWASRFGMHRRPGAAPRERAAPLAGRRTPAGGAGLAALDAHRESYLVPA
jgi:hypothetical protein